METTQKVLFVSAIAASLIAPTVVQADNCSGHYIETTTTSESAEIAKGTTLLSFRETNIGVTDDPNNPINMSAGECSGAGPGCMIEWPGAPSRRGETLGPGEA